jgi:MtN3 and saliva related transmembrane protein
MVNTVDSFGYIAGALTTVAFLPQVILAWRSKDLSAISLPMYLIFVTGAAFWLIFGLLADIKPTVVSNIVTLVLAGSVLWLKIRDQLRHKRKGE